MHRVLGALLLLRLLPAAAWAAASDPRETARAILKNDRYQTELPRPRGQGRSAPSPSPWPRFTEEEEPPTPPRFDFRLPNPPRGLTVVILLAILAVGLAFLLRRLSPPAAASDGSQTPLAVRRPRTARARAPDDPELLAREGRFAEAIHALLLRALSELGRGTGSPAASPAATSREVLRSAGLAPDAKEALAPLVGAVEWMHFGRGTAGAEEYAACAEHYRRFREACRA
jgi:hypothetical protein